MKFFIAFACLLALAAANDDVQVIRNDADVGVDHFEYTYEFDNSIKSHQSGALKDKDTWVVDGKYEYVSPEGEHIALSYTADETGYHPDPNSPLLPTPHPIPEHIVRAIAYIQAHPSKDAH